MNFLCLLSETEHHGPPASLFTPVYLWFLKNFHGAAEWMGFTTEQNHLGQIWFEALGYAIVSCLVLILLAHFGTRNLQKIPKGLQNLLEMAVGALRKMVDDMVGPTGSRYVPFIGTSFLFIFVMNLMGILPAGRSPTMSLSITAGLGITAIVLVQYYTIRDAGIGNVLKHLAGPVWWLAPLIFFAELISEFVRPVSLSMRLYANIYGEDNIIEAIMHLGGWFPVQFPILLLALLTSFLQAYVFTMLCTYYIASKVAHEEHEEHGGHEEEHPAAGHSEAKSHA